MTDDGHGIVSTDMYNIAKRGYTSRLREKSDLERHDFQYFGYRGESLSSISEFCELEITSRNMHEKDSFRKVASFSSEDFMLAPELVRAGCERRESCVVFKSSWFRACWNKCSLP